MSEKRRKERQASEPKSFEDALTSLAEAGSYTETVINRLRHIRPIEPGASILDVGAAQGASVIWLAKQGYRAAGVEP